MVGDKRLTRNNNWLLGAVLFAGIALTIMAFIISVR